MNTEVDPLSNLWPYVGFGRLGETVPLCGDILDPKLLPMSWKEKLYQVDDKLKYVALGMMRFMFLSPNFANTLAAACSS